MKTYLLSIIFFLNLFLLFGNSDPYELVIKLDRDKIYPGDLVEFIFYCKNNSSSNISVPSIHSRAIGDVLKQEFKVFDKNRNQINKKFRCGLRGSGERRVFSGSLIKPGDSVIILKQKIKFPQIGVYEGDYTYNFQPRGMTSSSPIVNYKPVFFKEKFKIEVIEVSKEFEVKRKPIPMNEVWRKPTFSSLEEAYKSPDEVYSLSLNNFSLEQLEEVLRFKNIQQLSIKGEINSVPKEINSLDVFSLTITNTKGVLLIDSVLSEFSNLDNFSFSSPDGIEFVGLKNKIFPNLSSFVVLNVSKPFKLPFDFNNTPKLRSLQLLNIDEVTFGASDFSKTNLRSITIKAKKVNFSDELVAPKLLSLFMYNITEQSIPDMRNCIALEDIHFGTSPIQSLPSSIAMIPNLKRLSVVRSVENNDCLKALKKKRVQIEKVK